MDSPRGRIYLMRALEEGTLEPSAAVVRHLDLCLGCRACETACPSGVAYGDLIEAVRPYVEQVHRRAPVDRLRRWAVAFLFPHPQRLRRALWPLRLLEGARILRLARRWSALAAMLPELRRHEPLPELVPPQIAERRRVALLKGCVADVLFSNTNHATLRVLARNGCTVTTPAAQGCCGALYLHAGDHEAALACARRNLDAFPDKVDAVVANAAGCGAMLKQYGELLAEDPVYAARAAAFSARVRDVSELLAPLPIEPPSAGLAARVTYHDACHLAHAQGIRTEPRHLLGQIPGVELVELGEADTCCGSAGSYNLTEPAMARRLGDRKAKHVMATGADIVAVGNPGCAMQIQASLRRCGSRIEVCHPIELLDRAYRRSEGATSPAARTQKEEV